MIFCPIYKQVQYFVKRIWLENLSKSNCKYFFCIENWKFVFCCKVSHKEGYQIKRNTCWSNPIFKAGINVSWPLLSMLLLKYYMKLKIEFNISLPLKLIKLDQSCAYTTDRNENINCNNKNCLVSFQVLWKKNYNIRS